MTAPANPVLINAEKISKSFGIKPLLESVSVGVHAGQRIGVRVGSVTATYDAAPGAPGVFLDRHPREGNAHGRAFRDEALESFATGYLTLEDRADAEAHPLWGCERGYSDGATVDELPLRAATLDRQNWWPISASAARSACAYAAMNAPVIWLNGRSTYIPWNRMTSAWASPAIVAFGKSASCSPSKSTRR